MGCEHQGCLYEQTGGKRRTSVLHEISNKIGLSERDNNNWFAMSIIRELLEEKQVEKEIKDNKTKYKIPGRVYIEMPEV